MAGTIGLIGGTGPEGKGLAVRFAFAGREVIVGSRSAERAREAAAELGALARQGSVRGADNAAAAAEAEIVIVTLPYAAQAETLSALAAAIGSKVVVSTVVPLEFARRRVSVLDVPDGSAAQEEQRLLPQARVVGAFHNLAAGKLMDLEHSVAGDVIVCGDDAEAVQQVIELAGLIEGVRGVNGGPLANSRFVEGLTALQISINRIYKTESGIQVTGI